MRTRAPHEKYLLGSSLAFPPAYEASMANANDHMLMRFIIIAEIHHHC
jgi:hypothetical protein